jgi:hypothetical protein
MSRLRDDHAHCPGSGRDYIMAKREMSERQPRPERQDVYGFPSSVGWLGLVGVVFFWSATLCALLLLIIVGDRALEAAIGSVLVLGPLGWYALDAWRRRDEHIQIGTTHITLLRASGSQLVMRWDEIVQIRERFLLRRLELVDIRRRVLPVEFQLRDFARLREIIQERIPSLRDRHARAHGFRRYGLGRWPLIALLAFLVGFALVAVFASDWRGALSLTAFAGLLAAWTFTEVRSVRVGPHEVILQRFIGARRIPYTAITRIDLVDAESEGVAAGVTIALRSGAEIKLQGFLEGYLALFDSLSEAWNRNRTGA